VYKVVVFVEAERRKEREFFIGLCNTFHQKSCQKRRRRRKFDA
jgi:hypothetical protein